MIGRRLNWIWVTGTFNALESVYFWSTKRGEWGKEQLVILLMALIVYVKYCITCWDYFFSAIFPYELFVFLSVKYYFVYYLSYPPMCYKPFILLTVFFLRLFHYMICRRGLSVYSIWIFAYRAINPYWNSASSPRILCGSLHNIIINVSCWLCSNQINYLYK